MAVMIITTQLLQKKKKKVLKSEVETLLLRPSPAVLPPDSHQSPGTDLQPEQSSPSLRATHTPCLYDTIWFLLQLFSSVVKHSSEMRPATFVPSQNPPLTPWMVRACLSPGSQRLQLHRCRLASALPLGPFLPSSQFSRKAMPFFFQTTTSKACEHSLYQKLGLAHLCKAGLLLEEGLMSR